MVLVFVIFEEFSEVVEFDFVELAVELIEFELSFLEEVVELDAAFAAELLLFLFPVEVFELALELELDLATATSLFEDEFADDEAVLLSEELFFAVASEVDEVVPDFELLLLADVLFLATAFELLLDVEVEFADDEAELLPEEFFVAVASEVVPDFELLLLADALFLATAF